MSLLVHKNSTGLPYHALLEEDRIKWVNDIGDCELLFGVDNSINSVEPLFKLFNVEVKDLVPEAVKRSFLECGYSGQVPWSYVIPKRQFTTLLKGFLESIQKSAKSITSSRYSDFFIETNELFSLLKPSKIDNSSAKRFLEQGDNHVLKSIIKMSTDNTLPPPSYDRVSTKTGRLLTRSGPQVLTLKKEFRSIFVPTNPGNKLYEIDFVSLEPRVALNIADRKVQADVYTSFAEDSGTNITRDTAKLAVLCALYGAGKYRLESLLREDGSKMTASTLLRKVKEYFSIDALSRSLAKEAEGGKITNCFGRPVEVDDNRSSMLVNNFLQSSAVDVALLGFLDFCKEMKSAVIPLFVIHDALVFESSPEHIGSITEYVDNGFNIKNMGNFPLKLTEFGFHE